MRRFSPATVRRSDSKQRKSNRNGLTLIEVIVSTAIFLGAMTAIFSLMDIGHQARISAGLDAEAALRCEGVLGELVSGIKPLASVDSEAFEDNENWRYSVLVDDANGEGLMQLTVVVEHVIGENDPNSSFQIKRLMRDPQMFLDAAMESSEAAE